MNRREFLQAAGAAALIPMLPRALWAAAAPFKRRRPSDGAWPSKAAWKRLNDAVRGNLIAVSSPLSAFKATPDGAAAKRLWSDLENPYYIDDEPGLTHTLGWVDGWVSKPSVYAVAARSAQDIAAAVNFARENDLRLVVKGAGHSYQGTSDAPDSLLIWTRYMNDITMHPAFVPQGCEQTMKPQPAATLGAGAIWMQAYEAVTTQGGRYVQGGGCLTVGVAGLIQSGGFGSLSKRFGTAAGNLLEAEVVTADGQIRVANACTNPDLFWALKGGGGGTFGAVSKVTVRSHDLPEYFGTANFTVKASSDDSYRRLIREFVSFYRENLFNQHWGEQFHVKPGNSLAIRMVSQGLDAGQAQKVWQPFLKWVKGSPRAYSFEGRVTIGSMPARHFWDVQWWKKHWPEVAFPRDNFIAGMLDDVLDKVIPEPILDFDPRPGASPNNAWWKGDAGQSAWFIWAFESQWMPASLLEDNAQQRLAKALFNASRYAGIELHCNKGLAGAPPAALAGAKDTAMNPAVLSAFALAIVADAENRVYPGVPDHEPSVAKARQARTRIQLCVNELKTVTGDSGSYVSESNYFQEQFQQAYWGGNYPRLARIKQKYDPDGLFFVHNGVGSEQWSRDGFTKL